MSNFLSSEIGQPFPPLRCLYQGENALSCVAACFGHSVDYAVFFSLYIYIYMPHPPHFALSLSLFLGEQPDEPVRVAGGEIGDRGSAGGRLRRTEQGATRQPLPSEEGTTWTALRNCTSKPRP